MLGCSYCGTSMGADGILGTNICFTQECKDRVNSAAAADAALKQAQATALTNLGQQQSAGISTGAIVAIVLVVIVLSVGVFLLIRKKSK